MTDDPESRSQRLTHEQLVAQLVSAEEYRNELRTRQISPERDGWQHAIELRLRDGQEDAALDLYYDLSSWLQSLLTHREERRAFELYQSADRTYAGYGNLLRALTSLAPFLEDVRFAISDWSEDWVDEYEITGGVLRASRGFYEEDLDYWAGRVVREPDDEVLRRFAARSHVDEVQEPLRQLDRLTGANTPLEEAQRGLVWPSMETSHEDLIRTGRCVELLDSCEPLLASCASEQRATAAAYLLGWAEIYRIRAAHDREKAKSAALASQLYAAAAAIDPLAGSVAYYHSLLLGKTPAGQAQLEAGLLVGPEHLCILGALGISARAAGDWQRAIELLERCVAVFRRLHQDGPFGLYWDNHRAELWTAYYQRACFTLYGVPPGAPRPAGRPSDETLAAVAAALAPVLALAEELPSGSRPRARASAFQCMSLIAAHLEDHAAAFEWADRSVAADPNVAHAWSTKGGCCNNLGRLDEAIACSARALELDRTNTLWHAHLVLACVMAKQGGRRDEIFAKLRRVLELWPDGRGEIASEPDLASLREDPEFRELVAEPG